MKKGSGQEMVKVMQENQQWFPLLMANTMVQVATAFIRFPELVVKRLVQALPSVQTLQCPNGRLDNNNNNKLQ